jgi:hypothetical protein
MQLSTAETSRGLSLKVIEDKAFYFCHSERSEESLFGLSLEEIKKRFIASHGMSFSAKHFSHTLAKMISCPHAR